MKRIFLKTYLLTFTVLSLAIAAGSISAQVYRVVDEHGNVIYTDRPPETGAEAVELPPLSIIEVPVYEKTARQKAEEVEASGEQGKEVPLRTLRRDYRDFVIVSPQQEESVWHPEGPVPIAWRTGKDLQQGMKVTIFVDGNQQATTTQPIIPVSGLERGEHTVTAEIKDARNRKIATADPVTFFIRQPTIYNRPRVGPGGGG
jgi:hypothetical protein